MLNRTASRKSCTLCALALAVPVGYFALGGLGSGRAAAVPPPTAADVQQEPKSAQQKQVDAVTKHYLEVQQLLAQDKLEGVAAQLAKIHESARTLSESEDAKVAEQAKSIAKRAAVEPKTLKQARDAFKPLSASVTGLVRIVPPSDDAAPALYEANCPMAKANWLQTSKEVVNPYMGKAMLDCGSVKRTIKAPEKSEPKKAQAAGSAEPTAACPMTGPAMGCCGS